MQVAFVTPFLPWPADTGGKLRSFHLVKGLAAGNRVDLFTFRHSPVVQETGPLASLCRTVDVTQIDLDPGAMRVIASVTSELPRSVRYFQTGRA